MIDIKELKNITERRYWTHNKIMLEILDRLEAIEAEIKQLKNFSHYHELTGVKGTHVAIVPEPIRPMGVIEAESKDDNLINGKPKEEWVNILLLLKSEDVRQIVAGVNRRSALSIAIDAILKQGAFAPKKVKESQPSDKIITGYVSVNNFMSTKEYADIKEGNRIGKGQAPRIDLLEIKYDAKNKRVVSCNSA